MGKRKSTMVSRLRRQKRKKPEKLETEFACPFCGLNDSVTCSFEFKKTALGKEKRVGVVECRVCKISYRVKANPLSEPIDVYSEWIDDCRNLNLQQRQQEGDEPDQDACYDL